jgi:two-component system cell cycle sensor histidine kinase/response regulator CckA
LIGLIDRTLNDADQDRYTLERAMDALSVEMQALYRELERTTENEIATLRMSNERHQLLFEENPLPIWVLDAQTLRYLAINDAMIRTYGYSRDEFLGMSVIELKPPDEVSELVQHISRTSPGAVSHVGVRTHRCKDGTMLDMDITIHAISFEGRRAMLGIALDTTRARQLEEDLRQAQKMEAIGQLAGGVAHDFNNILAVILANAEFGLEDLGAGATHLAEIRDAANRGAALTRQLLTFSRKQQRQARPLALNAVVTELHAMLMRVVGEDICISTAIAPDLGTIEADRGEVGQILMNLVVNARDAMPEGGKLQLQTANVIVDHVEASHLGVPPGAYVVLAVSDSGCGMSAAVQTRIFEPFFTTKEVNKGTGLGLSTVFGIVKQGGGGISVRSELGRGTTFRVYLPRIDAVVTTTEDLRVAPPRGSGTVLLVEDDVQLRHILRRYISSWGYTLIEASCGKSALEVARTYAGEIDVLLTDLVMPNLDGRSLSREVLIERPAIAVVFMSGYTEHAALANAAIGPDELFIQKPFSAQILADTLQQAFGRSPTSTTRSAESLDASTNVG